MYICVKLRAYVDKAIYIRVHIYIYIAVHVYIKQCIYVNIFDINKYMHTYISNVVSP